MTTSLNQSVIEIRDSLIDEYGGRKGILNEGLLRSTLEMAKQLLRSDS